MIVVIKYIIRSLLVVMWIAIIYACLIMPSFFQVQSADTRSIRIYTWAHRIDENMIRKFEKKTGIKVYLNYYESSEELLTKLEMTPSMDCDIMLPSGYVIQSMIIPAVVDYQNRLIKNVEGLFSVLGDKAGKEAAKTQIELIQRIAIHTNKMKASADAMLMARKAANKLSHAEDKAFAYCDTVKVHFDEIRYHADKLELLIDDESWPLPKFREMLFTR